MQIDKLTVVKRITSFVVGAGTTRVVHGIIQNNTNAETRFDKIAIVAADFVIGAMAAKSTKQYSDELIDEVVDAVKEIKQAKKLSETPTEVVQSELVEETEETD